jgi:eukaryotic-like serine/threonine-protein kinase
VRRVAIKLARSAVSSDRALARFESERQTLATMNHPNIARVFDAGSSPDSRPYFVMECVAGESITDFCDRRELGIEPRLELLARVCDGVQHAHLNAVIHRDLKPSNILVTTEGGPPTPKIIDFGVAKALDNGVGPKRGLTQFGQLVGTPEYMSPEQAALDGRPVDTRTDVYSLAVVLYELLTGERPFERETGQDPSLADLCHRIRELEPEPPSARAQRRSSTTAARRGNPGCAVQPRLRARQLGTPRGCDSVSP